LRTQIDELNSWIYDNVNNGVYKAGFATSQQAYDEAVEKVFESLARLEQILGQHRYLTGDRLTEADIRLWTTLIRFDPVYVTHFKCDKHRISDYLNLYGFLRDIYQMPGIAETVNFDHIRTHYYRSHKTINPTGLSPSARGRILTNLTVGTFVSHNIFGRSRCARKYFTHPFIPVYSYSDR
jgi:putative glutathione S-transferase